MPTPPGHPAETLTPLERPVLAARFVHNILTPSAGMVALGVDPGGPADRWTWTVGLVTPTGYSVVVVYDSGVPVAVSPLSWSETDHKAKWAVWVLEAALRLYGVGVAVPAPTSPPPCPRLGWRLAGGVSPLILDARNGANLSAVFGWDL